MEKAFWTAGPVPPVHLASLALARPLAAAALRAALAAGTSAWIGGPPGQGMTTLVHQAASSTGRPILVVDLRAMVRADPEEAFAHVSRVPAQGRRVRAPTSWNEAIEAWHPRATLAFDGADPSVHGWILEVAAELGRPVLAAGAGGDLMLDPIPADLATRFLEGRTRGSRRSWTSAALREAVGLCGGDPAILQAVGAGALHACLERGDRRIALDDVLESAIDVAQHRASGPPPWRGLVGPRRALLMAMAIDPDGTVTAWARRCGIEPKAAVVHLRRMAGRDGLVHRAGRGAYAMAPMLRLALGPSGGAVVRLVRPGTNPPG